MAESDSNRRFIILTYHRVLPYVDQLRPEQMDRSAFQRQMTVLSKYFNVLSLNEAYFRMESGELPRRAVVITFDDGYADNLYVALPILKHHNLPATVFIASGFLNGGRMWNDTIIEAVRQSPLDRISLESLGIEQLYLDTLSNRRNAIRIIISKVKYLPANRRIAAADKVATDLQAHSLPTDLMMTNEDILKLHGEGIEIGGHTVSHPILAQLSSDEAMREVLNGRRYLEERLDARIRSFAYPNGKPGEDYCASHVDAVRHAGFDVAVSTAWGAVCRFDDPLQLPRVGFAASAQPVFAYQLLRSYFGPQASRV